MNQHSLKQMRFFLYVLFLRVVLLCSLPAMAAEPCPPSVVITGHSDLVRSLFATDALSDVSQTALPGCPAVWVAIEQQENALFIRIDDHLGRRYERTVGDVDTAAVIIESWARGDALMSVLPAVASPAPPPQTETVEDAKPASEPAVLNASPPKDNACGETNETSSRDVIVGAGFEFSWGADSSAWFGGSAYWCTMLGLTCLGTVIRGAADPTISGEFRGLTAIRASMDVMLAISLPIAVRRVRISPTVGLGTGWIQTSKDVVEDNNPEVKETSFGGVRLALSCMVSVNLVHGLYFDTAAGLTTSFIAEEEKVFIDGEAVAGEPRNYIRFVTGLSYRWF